MLSAAVIVVGHHLHAVHAGRRPVIAWMNPRARLATERCADTTIETSLRQIRSSVASLVEVAAAEAAGDQVLGECDRRPADRHVGPSAARRAASVRRLLLRRPGFVVGIADPAVLDRLRDRRRSRSRRTTRSTSSTRRAATHAPRTSWAPIMLGRDVLSRVMAGARDVLIAAPTAAIARAWPSGPCSGSLMGYYRGWIDEVLEPHHRGAAVDPGHPRGPAHRHVARFVPDSS